MSRDAEERVKLFGITNQLLEHDLDRVEREFVIDLQRGHQPAVAADEAYYPQIEASIRAEAASMAPHYEVFYSLETSIRTLVEQALVEAEGVDWWNSERVPQQIRENAEAALKKERDSGVTVRSEDMLDYTNFGDLSQLIEKNWDLFGWLESVSAVKKVLAGLNTLRGPIAHCSPLAEDEVLRLQLSVRDWFRLME